jgi:hypothetical protein
MKKSAFAVWSLTASLLLISGLVQAHHSNAVADKDKIIMHAGKVTKLFFGNPHVAVYFSVKDAQGNEVEWFAGGAGPQTLRKEAGWNNKTLLPGDEVIVQGNPNRDGRPVMTLRGLYRCNGERVGLSRGIDEPGEYITRVPAPELSREEVRTTCSAAGLGAN